ncbi:hypothetical protein Tco_0734332 [Tanacetum coccineum]
MPITKRQLVRNLQKYSMLRLLKILGKSMSKLIITIFKTDHNTRIKRIIDNLQEVQNDVKGDHALNKKVLEVNLAHTATISQTKGEKDDMITKELVSKTANVEKESEQEPQDTETIPIIIVKPTVTPSEPEIIRSSSRPQLTDPIVEVQVSQPESLSHTNPKHDRGKCIARDTDESPRKLVKASTEVLVTEIGVDLKALQSAKGGQNFLKKQDAEIKVLNRELLEKLTNEKELRKKRIDQYRWTTSSRRKPETITDIHIHLNTKPVEITVYKGNDKRTFHVYKPFRLRATPDELGIKPTLSTIRQVLSLTSGRKRKAQELEPKVHIPRLECNRILPERMSDIHKVDVDTLLGYLVMALNISTPANQRLCALLRSLIESYPDKEMLKSKKVKLEAIRYSMN